MSPVSTVFTVALHQRLVRDVGAAGFVWSPYSVASALGMAAAGARGATRDELAAALAPSAGLAALARDLANGQPADGRPRDGEVGWAVANTLWHDTRVPVEPAYLAAIASWPAGTARTAPFQANPEAARGAINADVEATTQGLIRDLIPRGLITAETGAVLANALWLRAGWRRPFNEHATADAPFHAPSGRREVPTMRGRLSGGYAAAEGWQVVRLPAAGGVVADVLLPDGDLAAAEGSLTPELLGGLLDRPRAAELELHLPRCRVEGSASLVGPLADLGVRRLFTPREADLTGIARTEPPLHVSAAVHKAVLQIDEQGLEGAAATAVIMEPTAAIISAPVVVRVDRPFLLLVRHVRTGVVYFAARVTEP
jgi:serpin B